MKKLTKMQKSVLGVAMGPMLVVGVAGGIGTYSNISGAYGSGTAIGALAAGEGATVVLALLLLGLTMLGQSAPAIIRIGLWALPATAAVIGATAATKGTGETIVYAATPMAITAAAEGIAFLVRRIVVHTDGCDVEAQARATAVIRDLAYHQARATAHPSKLVRKYSVRRSWRLARKVGHGDVGLSTELLAVQRTRLVASAGTALERMFTPDANTTSPGLPPASADATPALPPASANDASHDATASRDHDVMASQPDVTSDVTASWDHDVVTSPADAAGSPLEVASAQLDGERSPSIAAEVRRLVERGVTDAAYIAHTIADRVGRSTDDPKYLDTVKRNVRAASGTSAVHDDVSAVHLHTPQGEGQGLYL